MITSVLDHIAGGLALIYRRPLGHDAAVVFLLAFALTIVITARRRTSMLSVLRSSGAGLMTAGAAPAPFATTSWVRQSGSPGVAAILALVLTWGVHLLPVAVGIHFSMQGEIVRGLIYAALAVLWTQAFFTLLPLWFVAGWYEYGLGGSLAGNGLMFLALTAPGWLLRKPHHVDWASATPARAPSTKEDRS